MTAEQSLSSDAHIIEALKRGDEVAFVTLIDKYQMSMVRVAMLYVPNRAIAEEVVQETWIAVLKGLTRFEGRSSLKTWIYSILINRAKTHAQREGRYVPLSWDDGLDTQEVAVPEEHFHSANHWQVEPESWGDIPEEQLLSKETLTHVQEAINALPPNQKTVITLRDVEGLSAEEVCNVLGVSETNQRVLLHRARAKVRGVLEQYLKQ